MFKTEKAKIFLVSTLAVFFALMMMSSSIISGQADSFADIQEQLTGISEEKGEILKYLFVLVQEIEEMEREEEGIAREIEIVNREVEDLAVMIAQEETTYEKKRDVLKQVLKSYQRGGPGSFLEIILDSNNLTTFLRRINTLRDLTRGTGELLEALEESREKLLGEKRKLGDKLALLEDKQEQLRGFLAKKVQLKEDQEEYLASLEEEREYYQEQLADIQQVWDQLKPLFPEITREFSRIIAEGNLPQDALKTTFTLSGIKGSLDEKTFNEIIAGHQRLPEMVFSFNPGKIEMRLPQKNLVLAGIFVILEGHTLKFQAQEGSFYGLPLERAAIEELFREGDLVLDLKPLVGGSILHSIEIQKGYLELEIVPALFH